MGGGHNWQATSYSPQTGLYYFNTTDGCHLYYKTDQDFIPGQWFQGSTIGGIPTEPLTGRLLAVDPATGNIKWQFETVSPPSAGVLATAGGLVFTGEREGYFEAFDARTGKLLYRFQTGGVIGAPPIAYSLHGKQYIVVAADWLSAAWDDPPGTPLASPFGCAVDTIAGEWAPVDASAKSSCTSRARTSRPLMR